MKYSIFAIAVSTAAIAQTTRVVPTEFSTISDAVAASAPGDIIRVLEGAYDRFTVSRGITIIGEGRVRVFRGITITGVPAGEVVKISGLRPNQSQAGATPGFDVVSCNGSVHLSDMQPSIGDTFASIRNSAFVTLERFSAQSILNVLRVESSYVQIANCTMTGLVGTSSPLRLTNSVVRCGATTIQMGQPFTPASGHGIEQLGGTLTLGAGCSVNVGSSAVPLSAIESDGTIFIDPSVVLTSSGGAPPISGTATTLMIGTPSTAITASTVGGMFSGRVVAMPGASCGTLLGLPAPPIPTPFGPFELGGFALAIDAGAVPATGVREWSFPVSSTTPIGFTLSIQAFVNDGSLLRLSTASTAVLGL